jgi:hypothetical protein
MSNSDKKLEQSVLPATVGLYRRSYVQDGAFVVLFGTTGCMLFMSESFIGAGLCFLFAIAFPFISRWIEPLLQRSQLRAWEAERQKFQRVLENATKNDVDPPSSTK